MLSEKAKGKQKAVEPLHSGESHTPQLDPPLEQARDLVIRFTEGFPDLVVAVGQKDAVRDVKRKIREGRPELKDRRLRLIHSGRLLTEGTFLYSWLVSLEERQKRATPNDTNSVPQSPTEAAITWMHCSVGLTLEPGEAEEEGRTQTAQLQPARGFDRLASVGFSETDIANFRRQFHSQSSSNYLDDDFETEEEYDEHARALEEQWIDSIDNAGTASLSQSSPSNITVLQGILLGFFFPLIPFFFMRHPKPAVFWDDGSEYEPPGNETNANGASLSPLHYPRFVYVSFCVLHPSLFRTIKMANALYRSPICNAAPELLLHIFTQCLLLDSLPVCGIHATPVVISQVCAGWRTLVLNSSHLWSSFKIIISDQPSPSPSFVQLWIERSAFRPMKFCLELDEFPPVHDMALVTRAGSVLDVLAIRSHFWKDVSLILPGSYALLECASDLAMPRLQTLELTLRNCHPDDFKATDVLLQNCPSLSSFTWSNRSSWGRWDRALENTLTPSFVWQNLTCLVYNSSISLSSSYAILLHCTNLVSCDLRHFGIGDTPSDLPPLEPIFFFYLTTLKIYQENLDMDLGLFMDFVIAPSLRTLSLTCGRVQDMDWPQRVISLFSRSSCELESLCLEYTGITEEELIHCLRSNHVSLRHLELYDRCGTVCVGDTLLHLLTRRHGQDDYVICPKLVSLTLHGVIRSSDMVLTSMLQSQSRFLTCADLNLFGENTNNVLDSQYLTAANRGDGNVVEGKELKATLFRVVYSP
ncbi:hypothetical protein DXG01_010096 [Tephrocybe rancida]|nr:hypothetical protein DXG01_010096 [Tephrocybe rancida]